MKNREPTDEASSAIDDPSSFWAPPSEDVIRSDLQEFRRRMGLMPELAEALGLREYLREDTLKSVN